MGWSYWRLLRSQSRLLPNERRFHASSSLDSPLPSGGLPELSSLGEQEWAIHSIDRSSEFGRGCKIGKRKRLDLGLRRVEVDEGLRNLSEVVLQTAGFVTSCSEADAALKGALTS